MKSRSSIVLTSRELSQSSQAGTAKYMLVGLVLPPTVFNGEKAAIVTKKQTSVGTTRPEDQQHIYTLSEEQLPYLAVSPADFLVMEPAASTVCCLLTLTCALPIKPLNAISFFLMNSAMAQRRIRSVGSTGAE